MRLVLCSKQVAGAIQMGDRRLNIVLLVMNHTQAIVGFGIVGIGLEHLLILGDRRLKLVPKSGLMAWKS